MVPSPTRITPGPGMFDRFTRLPVNIFPTKLAPNVPSNLPRIHLFGLLLHFQLFQ